MGVWISSFSALLQFISVDDVDIAWCISDYRHPKFGMQIGQLHQAKRGHCVKWRPSTPQVYWHIDIDITFANIITCVCVHHVMMSCHVMSCHDGLAVCAGLWKNAGCSTNFHAIAREELAHARWDDVTWRRHSALWPWGAVRPEPERYHRRDTFKETAKPAQQIVEMPNNMWLRKNLLPCQSGYHGTESFWSS
jgi:hypothetical protein